MKIIDFYKANYIWLYIKNNIAMNKNEVNYDYLITAIEIGQLLWCDNKDEFINKYNNFSLSLIENLINNKNVDYSDNNIENFYKALYDFIEVYGVEETTSIFKNKTKTKR